MFKINYLKINSILQIVHLISIQNSKNSLDGRRWRAVICEPLSDAKSFGKLAISAVCVFAIPRFVARICFAIQLLTLNVPSISQQARGYHVITTLPLPADILLCLYLGEVDFDRHHVLDYWCDSTVRLVSSPNAASRCGLLLANQFLTVAQLRWYVLHRLIVCPFWQSNLGRFFNGVKTVQEKANVKVQRILINNVLNLVMFTGCAVNANEELIWEYGSSYWQDQVE